jgi:carboxyl-terminal processing protease
VGLIDRRIVLGFALGVAATVGFQAATPSAEAGKTLQRETFHGALDMVLDEYVEPVDSSALMGRGLKHMVSGLDPYSYYLTADERRQAQRRQRSGATTGLVVSLHPGTHGHGAALEVSAVLPDSSAARAGLSAGDRILELRGQRTAFLLSQAEAEVLLSGGVGERIPVTVQRSHTRAPEAVELELERVRKSDLVEAKLVSHGGQELAHVRIRSFRQGTGEQFKRALTRLEEGTKGKAIDGVIIDLRGNPGGEVSEALVIADHFLEEGILTRTRGRGGRILREERAHKAGSDIDTPIVVLQDHRSASASELLAVALQDHGRAVVIGERSYGKGTVQQVTGLSDGSLLTLTIARYFSPKDRVIDGQGVVPDVKLPSDARPVGVDPVDFAAKALVDRASG